MAKFHYVVLTKDEPTAFRIVGRLAEQVGPEGDVIVLDDFSCDNFIEVMKAYQNVFPWVRIVRRALNCDFASQKNFVKTLVPDGDWQVFIDSDEWVSSRFVRAVESLVHCGCSVWSLPRLNTLWGYLGPDRYNVGHTCHIPVVDWPHHPAEDTTMMLNKLGAMSYPDDQTKIVRNLANVAYRLKVHEQVWDDRGFVVPKALRYPDTHIFHHKHISHFPTRYDSWPR